ncbi:MAG TPA: ABC transporter ATP-binding protein [Chitinophagales bacterium]|nr:ABC transporter ATP-binding protein [Chitinophagales bacterium]
MSENSLTILEVNNLSKSYAPNQYAIKNVSFTLHKGDALGVIGKNGSGKTTLLKILSQIISPTSGQAVFYEKPFSIIEIGAGFHPDLSGKDNIYLSGALLGLTKKEIALKYHEIIEFSELEPAILQPVKTYSSGMYLRLAFSIAVSLCANILLIDEVLSVGDWAFTQKCYKKIGELLSSNSISLIFVSHNLQEVKTICNRCLLLSHGVITAQGTPTEVIDTYISQIVANNNFPDRLEYDGFVLSNFKVNPVGAFDLIFTNNSFTLSLYCEKKIQHNALSFMINIYEVSGNRILSDSEAIHEDKYAPDAKMEAGLYKVTCLFPANFFNHGLFSYNVVVAENHQKYYETPVLGMFRIHLSQWEVNKPWSSLNVPIRPRLLWITEQVKV